MKTPVVRQPANRRPVEYYLELRYPVLVHEDPEGGYVAEIPDLPGCMTQAETLPELFDLIEDARRVWIEATYEDGREIPLPRTESEYSGKFIVRLPASLHRRLVEAADAEGVSLNLYVVQLLSGAVGLDLVLRRIDEVGQAIAEVERSLGYALGSVPHTSRTPSRVGSVVTFTGSGSRRTSLAVAS